jgi:hypothetical protein
MQSIFVTIQVVQDAAPGRVAQEPGGSEDSVDSSTLSLQSVAGSTWINLPSVFWKVASFCECWAHTVVTMHRRWTGGGNACCCLTPPAGLMAVNLPLRQPQVSNRSVKYDSLFSLFRLPCRHNKVALLAGERLTGKIRTSDAFHDSCIVTTRYYLVRRTPLPRR